MGSSPTTERYFEVDPQHSSEAKSELALFRAGYSPVRKTDDTLIASTPVYEMALARDRLGRVTQRVETIQGTTMTTDFTYDAARRLDTVTENGVLVRDYEYDPNSNRLSAEPGGLAIASYDDQDRLLQYGTTTYTYTENGELLSRTDTTTLETTTYDYDVLGNLRGVTLPDSTQITYVIDGSNRRVGRRINGFLVQGFLYGDQLNPVAELDATGAVVSRFVYGSKVNVPEYMVKDGATYRIVSDHLGSVRLVIDTISGIIAQRIDYDEFGNITQDTNPAFQPFGFAGGLYDPATGLTRFGARDYDPPRARPRVGSSGRSRPGGAPGPAATRRA